MKLGHEQVEVDLKYLNTVSMQTIPASHGRLVYWQVKITMLNTITYHENFDSITAAADRVIEVRDWRLKLLEDKVEDLLSVLQHSNLDCTSEMSALYYRD